MDNKLRNELIITVIDKGILALIIGFILVGVQFLVESTLEKSRIKLEYERAVSERRVEKLEEIWHAVNAYAESVKTTLMDNNPTADEIIRRQTDLYLKLSQSGIHLGLNEINRIKESIEIYSIVEALKQNSESKFIEALKIFQDGVIGVLSDLEKKMIWVNFEEQNNY